MIKMTQQKMKWVQCYCWFYHFLTDKQKKIFILLMDDFIKKIKFKGVNIEITEEIKVAVAGWAVLLILNRPLNIYWYQSIKTIVIHPGRTVVSEDILGCVADGSHYCLVHLPWEHIRDVATKPSDNSNTLLHEFAHVLDNTDRIFNGQPTLLLSKNQIDEWKKVFSIKTINAKPTKKRKQLWQFFDLGRWNDFDPNNSSSIDAAELFAVSTEMFFEHPEKLNKFSSEMYQCLKCLYHFNPITQFQKQQKSYIHYRILNIGVMIKNVAMTTLNR